MANYLYKMNYFKCVGEKVFLKLAIWENTVLDTLWDFLIFYFQIFVGTQKYNFSLYRETIISNVIFWKIQTVSSNSSLQNDL